MSPDDHHGAIDDGNPLFLNKLPSHAWANVRGALTNL